MPACSEPAACARVEIVERAAGSRVEREVVRLGLDENVQPASLLEDRLPLFDLFDFLAELLRSTGEVVVVEVLRLHGNYL